jgi:predicted ATP-dependent serine protease
MATKKSTIATTPEIVKSNPGMFFKKIKDIEIADILFKPTKTGVPEIDDSFSELGGIIPSCMTLVTGTPGAGKTTLMMYIASRLHSKKPIVFFSYEMSDFQLKLMSKKIKNLDNILVVTEEFHKESRETLEKFVFGQLKDMDPGLVIVDSLQKMAGSMTGSFDKNQIWITELFTRFAKETFVPVNIIGHVSKDGTYKGPSTIKHEVDAHMQIYSEGGERFFKFSKNRFGGISDPTMFNITRNGITVGYDLSEVPEDQKKEAKSVNIHISNFATAAQNGTCPVTEFMKMATTVTNHLSDIYRDELVKTGVAKTSKIELTWEGKRIFCTPAKALLNFGTKALSTVRLMGGVGYKSEKPYIQKNCKTPQDVALWIVIHEFEHLFVGKNSHNKTFFTAIEKRFNTYKKMLAVLK